MASEGALLNAPDEIMHQNHLLRMNAGFMTPHCIKSPEKFFMCILYHVRAKGLVFRAITFEHCGGIETRACSRH